jgi:hypothetical protein
MFSPKPNSKIASIEMDKIRYSKPAEMGEGGVGGNALSDLGAKDCAYLCK